MSDTWYINGDLGNPFSPDSRGLAYGDGLFESMRLIGNEIPLLEGHLSRLHSGASRLDIHLDMDLVRTWLSQAMSQSFFKQAVVKLMCLRSGPALGYKAQGSDSDTLIRVSELNPQASCPRLKAKVCSLRLSAQPALAGIKHLNRLEQVLAARELSDEFDEGLLLDEQGHLIEAVSSNLILVKAQELIFPSLKRSGVAGVMQQYLKQIMPRLDLRMSERSVSLSELKDFDEILLTNAVRGVRNLASIQNYWETTTDKTGEQLRAYITEKLCPGFVSF